MKLSINQETLQAGIAVAIRAASTRSVLPVLANLLLETNEGGLQLSANNLETMITTWVPAKVDEPGSLTIPARLLADYVVALPPERVDLAGSEETATLELRCGRHKGTIKGIEAEEFPILPPLPTSGGIVLSPATFKADIGLVAFAAEKAETRPVLRGILLDFTPNGFTLAAADGFRLSVRSRNGLSGIEPGKLIVPAQALAEVAKLIDDDTETLTLYRDDRLVFFDLGDTLLIAGTIEGEFPRYNEVIPKSHTTRLELDTSDLRKALKLARLFARDASGLVRLEVTPADINPGSLALFATSAESGDCLADLPAWITGPATEVAFNVVYLEAVLSAATSPRIALELNDRNHPGVIMLVGDNEYRHVVMPMHIIDRRPE